MSEYSNYNFTEIEENAIKLYKEGLDCSSDNKKQYKKASEYFEKAKKEYLKLKNEKIVRAFKCAESVAKSIILSMDLEFLSIDKDSNIEEVEYNIVPEIQIVENLIVDLNIIKEKIHNLFKDQKSKQLELNHACSLHLIEVCRSFETFLYDRGLTHEAINVYVERNREKTEKLKYVAKILNASYLNWIGYKLRILGRKFWEISLGFGVKLSRIIFTTIVVIFLWGLAFWNWNLVKYEGIKNNMSSTDYLGHCLYYSLVSITSLGSEVHVPNGFWGRVFHSSEAIIGYGILAVILAFVTRKIK